MRARLRQLQKLPDFAARRRKFMKRYDERFAPFRQVVQPVSRLPGTDPCLHLYALLIDFEAIGRTRAEVMTELRARKIGTQVHYIPVHYQPYYRERYGKLKLPGTTQYYERVLSIPFYPAMKDEDIRIRRGQCLRCARACDRKPAEWNYKNANVC